MMRLLAIDPGPEESAYVLIDPLVIHSFKAANRDVLTGLIAEVGIDIAVCERIRSYGMPVGAEVFETCEWVGRFWQSWVSSSLYREWHFVTRKESVLNLCGNPRGKDANVRQAIIDRFGGKDKAIGKKACPGVLYGVSGDCWAALAVGLTWMDRQKVEV